jgi:hypothetical protein
MIHGQQNIKLIQIAEAMLAVQFVFRWWRQALVTSRAVRHWLVISEHSVQFPFFLHDSLSGKRGIEAVSTASSFGFSLVIISKIYNI